MSNISNEICRVCGSSDDLEMIFEKVNAEILKMLQAATPSDIKADDRLPKHICIPCIFTLEDFYEFKSLYECTHEKLMKKRADVLIKESSKEVTVRNDITMLEKKPGGVDELIEKEDSKNSQGLGKSGGSCDSNEDNCSNRLGEKGFIADENTANLDEKDQQSHIETSENINTIATESSTSPNEITAKERHDLFLNASISDEDRNQPDQRFSKSKSHQCSECGKLFEHLNFLKTHKSLQLCAGRSPCEINDEVFTTSGRLEEFLTLHQQPEENLSTDLENPKYKCNECGKIYSKLYSLKKHQVLHLNPDLYKCEVCDKSLSSLKCLREHAAVHSNRRTYKCDVCGKTFMYPYNLKAHEAKHLNTVLYQCEICGKSLSSKKSLKRHAASHSNRRLYKCYICGKSFSLSWRLKVHKARHANPNPFKCDKCPKSYSYLQKLKVHKALHSNPDLYQCDKCNKSYTNPFCYTNHMALHVNPGLYKCYDCGKSFQSSWSLKEHKVLHTNPSALKCNECGKTCSRLSALKRHQSMHLRRLSFLKKKNCESPIRRMENLKAHKNDA